MGIVIDYDSSTQSRSTRKFELMGRTQSDEQDLKKEKRFDRTALFSITVRIFYNIREFANWITVIVVDANRMNEMTIVIMDGIYDANPNFFYQW